MNETVTRIATTVNPGQDHRGVDRFEDDLRAKEVNASEGRVIFSVTPQRGRPPLTQGGTMRPTRDKAPGVLGPLLGPVPQHS
jgi:hypothetical protein